MKAKEFEEVVQYRMREEERQGRCSMGRYGVQARMEKQPGGGLVWHPVRSLPDFEGVLAPCGRQFILDCKVCGSASLNLGESKVAKLQLRHMLRRARCGAVCFLLIHWSRRELKTRIDPEATYAFPVADNEFWEAFERGEEKSISRADCEEYGVEVLWNLLPGGRTPRPDVLAAVLTLHAQ